MAKINNIKPIFAISGGSGSGKGAVWSPLHDRPEDICISISHTTRSPRCGEIHGHDYHFVSDQLFDQLINCQDFLEWEHVHQHRYGTRKSDFLKLVESGKKIIIEIDVNGAESLKKIFQNVITIFIAPPDIDTAISRLKNRRSENAESIAIRRQRYEMELEKAKKFDYIIVNDELEKARRELISIIDQH